METLRRISDAHRSFQLMIRRLPASIQMSTQAGIGLVSVAEAVLISCRLDEQHFLFMRKLVQLGRPRGHPLLGARHIRIDRVVENLREARRDVKMCDNLMRYSSGVSASGNLLSASSTRAF